jgi:hypothetical protein
MNTSLDRMFLDVAEGKGARDAPTLGEVLRAFEASEESSTAYRDLLMSKNPLVGTADWLLMAGLIRRMDAACDHWLEMSQRYCDGMARLKRSGPQKAMSLVPTS